MTKYYFTIFFLFFSFCILGQNQEHFIDSLKTELSKTTDNSKKLNLLHIIGNVYAHDVDERTFEIGKQAISLAQTSEIFFEEARTYKNYATYYEKIKDTQTQFIYLDKIEQLGKEKKDDYILAIAYDAKGMAYFSDTGEQDKDKVVFYLEKAIEFYKKSDKNDDRAEVVIQLGFYYMEYRKDYNRALEYYKQYNAIIGEDDIRIINTNKVISYLYSMQGKTEKALEYLLVSEKIFEKHNKTNSYSYRRTIFSIGNMYFHLKEYDQALLYYDKIIKKVEIQEDYELFASIYINRASIYKKVNDKDKAIDSLNEAEKVVEKMEECSKQEVYKEIGYLYFNSFENYDKALDYHLKADKTCVNSPYKFLSIAEEKYNLGYTYLTLSKNIDQIKSSSNEKPKDKIKLLQLSQSLFEKVVTEFNNIRNLEYIDKSYEALSEVYELQGNTQKAYTAYKQFVVYKDSLSNIQNKELLVQNQMQFEFDEKEKLQQAEQEIKDALIREEFAKEKSKRNMALGGVGIFVILAGASVFAYYQKKKDHQIIAKEKQKSDDLLLNILPEEIAHELKEKGTSEAKHFDSVSIMFTDFKDFTKLSENIPSKELIKELNYCFKAFDEIIVKHKIEKIKTIGDSYMAVCGLPGKQGNHAQKMIQAALEIRDFIEDYKQKKQKEGKSFFEMRIGINSGEVVAGIVGIKKFAYDIWGDAVNTASRMESYGEIGKVNISESTYNLVKDDFDFEYRGGVETKGKGKINMYFAERKQERTMEFEKAKEFILTKLENELPKHLTYHNIRHILDVYNTTVQYCELEKINKEDTELLKIASLFHDSGFIVQAEGHEQISCEFAEKYLPEFGYSFSQIEKIKGMIMATKIPQSPQNHLEQILSDADLDYLGRDDFEEVSEGLFEELKADNKISDRNAWNKIQISFFQKHGYFTNSAKQLREEKKQENLEKIKERTQL